MKIYFRDEPRTIAVASDTHTLTLRQVAAKSSHLSSSPVVAVELEPNSHISASNDYRLLLTRDIHGCLGLINIEKEIYLAVITGAQINVAHPVSYETVDKIYSVDFISLGSSEWDFVNLDSSGMSVQTATEADDFDPNFPRVVHPCWELKKLLSNGSFYFSNDFDLTSLLQNRGVDASRLLKSNTAGSRDVPRVNLQHYQEQFMWNSFLMAELIKFRSNLDDDAVRILNKNRFLTTVIRGFAKTVGLNTHGDTISIISKQSWKRAGTRFNARGIDDDGHVANFVETEFIYTNISQKQVYAFTQIRGSVPAFWEQDSTLINPKITITRSTEATQPTFNKHFDEVCLKYGACHIVNLLSKTKAQEIDILRRYKGLLDKSGHREETAYSHFDFHAETKQLSGGFAGATKILPMLYDSLETFGWYDYDAEQGEVVTRQDGVFRVNCLDCLDRTNLIEQVISHCVLEHILKNQSLTHGNSARDRMGLENVTAKHNSLWADNGDAISQIYTGTNALKSSFSRSGKMNFAGALSDVTKSVSRMYQNTFVDSKKQSTMDLLLGKDARNTKPVKIYDPINDFVHEKIKQNKGQFTTYGDVSVYVGTYNVNAAAASPNVDLLSWLFPPENFSIGCPDIYAIGLQELIELNAGSILGADTTKPTQWARLLEGQLNSQKEQYLLLRTEAIASLCLFLFVKKSQIHNVTQVSGSSKKTGLGGMTANKGACAVRFDFGSTSFALITSHLAAGINATVERHNDYSTIMEGLTFTRNYTLSDHDHIIWFGDLNYRINLPNDRCRSLIENGAFDELYALDQLKAEMEERGGAFRGFTEDKITFFPTYKFDKGTSNYDTSEKQRVPSWTDRVLYKSTTDDQLQSLNYNSVMDVFGSDHKPVFSTLRSKVKFVDFAKKLQLSREYYLTYKQDHGDLKDSLIDFDNGSASSASLTSGDFSIDTLSEMDLLEDANAPAPKLPLRPRTVNTLPRRVPPPPLSRKVVASEKISAQVFAPKVLPVTPYGSETESKAVSPPPPPPRNAGALNPRLKIGFSTPPLIPSNSNPSTPRSMSPNVAETLPQAQTPVKPLKPLKPQSLASSKIEAIAPQESPQCEGETKSKPVPPPPRAASSATGKTMLDWKPMVPQ